MAEPPIIAWDFDGVLNRNIRDGVFLWAENFERDLGQSLEVFTKHVFADDFDRIITGQEDLRDRVASWADRVGFAPGPDALLDYWFSNDALPDAEVLKVQAALSARGVRHVIATNNEARRARYIETEMGFADRVAHVFASGRMGVRKPFPAFYARITETLDVAPGRMILIDDYQASVEAARAMGWQAHFFSDDSRGDILGQLRAEYL
ncbi:HAD-IA family hydrolase [Ruegeria sp. 2012CJ41-6]|uniref:HAD-IA family hydrolase n=1 Tax=Ruegeria spongiae TaxID=2942209 RepID=A0ABT0Q2P9_9RHOB|nr:HAD-IA family hydrolase [Ruegeria spongiae]MCL6283189.1 HAD-IA family hydrolase [Ruegeria spongiae]